MCLFLSVRLKGFLLTGKTSCSKFLKYFVQQVYEGTTYGYSQGLVKSYVERAGNDTSGTTRRAQHQAGGHHLLHDREWDAHIAEGPAQTLAVFSFTSDRFGFGNKN